MTNHGDLLVAIALPDLAYGRWEVIDTILPPVHLPELGVVDGVLVVHLRVLHTRVVCQPDVEAEVGQPERHGFLIGAKGVGPALTGAAHAVLKDD